MANISNRSIDELRLPPQNIEAEKALLGSIMLKPEIIHEIADILIPECFYSEKHKIIYGIMLDLLSKGDPIDLLSVSSKLNERKKLERVGGRGYLTDLVSIVPSAANALYYTKIIYNKYKMRNLIEAAGHISSMGYDEGGDEEEIDELLDRAEKKIFNVTNLSKIRPYVHLKDELGEAWDRMDRLHKSGTDLRGISSGFQELDNKLSGFQKSDLVILAARPSMGKTSLALDIARKTAVNHNNAVCIFSLEMSSQQLVDRMLSAESRVDAWKLRTGKITAEDDFGRLRDSLDLLSKAPIFIDDQPGNTITKMRSVARRLKSERDIKLIIVDYLQLMIPSGRMRNSDSMVNQVTEISRSLKTLARELDTPIMALSQLSRAVEQRGGRPRLSDLRDSGSIEQDADVVIFIHREDKYKEDSDKPNIAELLIEKHRNGPTGKVELYFDDRRATFLSVEKKGFDDSSIQDQDIVDNF
ncbi:replicative DNA helicase [Patescibacteria group bacterium]|nr:replicative DNA helicase [Patescibacteria group bacterium]MBU4057748.1 replicative DNA helicase [Patescibacteria group bacterium]MBU4115990.1 replicative DNA helicase [Patescibacteria group bacterium]